MKGAFLPILVLVKLHLSLCCETVDKIMFCQTIPTEFPPGMSTLVFANNVELNELNSTALRSENLASITTARIRSGRLTRIAEGAFSSFQSLTNLALDRNLLTEINPKWLGRPAILADLSLSENYISALSGAMLDEFIKLNKLNLSNNQIRSIAQHTFSNLTVLNELDLSNNNLTKLTSQMFIPILATKMSLHGNPWDCSCDTEDFIEFVKDLQRRSLLVHSENVTCASPSALRGQPVWNVSVCKTPTLPSPLPDKETLSQPTTILTTAKHQTVSSPTQDKKTTFDLKTMLTLYTTTVSPSYTPNIVPMLITIIVVLCVALLLVIVLAVLHRRKRNRKIVAPGRQKEQVTEVKACRGQKTNVTAHIYWDLETPCQTSFTAVRAKSANAILFTSPIGVSGEDHVSPSQDKEEEVGKTCGIMNEIVKNNCDHFIIEAGNSENMVNSPSSLNDENISYLSIGSQQKKINQNETPSDPKWQRSKVGWGMHRISTWPPTAVQWQERCKRQSEKEREEEGGNGLAIWTQTEGLKMPGVASKQEYLANNYHQNSEEFQNGIGQMQNELVRDEAQKVREDWEQSDTLNQSLSNSPMSNQTDPIFSVSVVSADAVGGGHDPKSKGITIKKVNRKQNKTAKTGGEGRRSGSQAPSGGASPNDEALLDGNELLVQDLLHEVVQNHGRWTRDRWRQVHMNKQGPGQQGQR